MYGSRHASAFARSALVAFAVLASACVRTARDVQRDYASTLRPASLAEPAAASAARDLPVRVLVDEQYRAEILRWRERIEAQIERANGVLVPEFGVRLAVREIVPWSRQGRVRTLRAAMEDLLAADPGADVEWVLGFVSSSELFSGSHEQLGMANLFGRHLVLRGAVSSEEQEAFRRTLDRLTDAEREALLHERQLHRETAVLLHEWAHTLGAFHEKDGLSLMSPRYDAAQAAFSEAGRRIIELGLSHRSTPGAASRREWAAAYRAEVERARAAAWDSETAAQALASARALEGGAPSPESQPPPAAGRSPSRDGAAAEDARVLSEAEMNERLGDVRRALALVEPLAARLASRTHLQRWVCHLRRRAGVASPASTACGGQKALSAPQAMVLFARALVEAGDPSGAAAALLRAEAAFAGGRPPTRPADWAQLAGILARIHACTAAERVAARAPGEYETRTAVVTCASTRRRGALPAGVTGVGPEREPEYVERVLRGHAAALDGRGADARAAALALEAEFPGAPGGALVRCMAEASLGDAAAARIACTAADRELPAAFEPAFVLAEIAGHGQRWSEARDHLVRALAREEGQPDVWSRLGAVYRKLGDEAALEALDRRHRKRFGVALRPAW